MGIRQVRQRQNFSLSPKVYRFKVLGRHSFKKIATAFGIRAFEINSGKQIDKVLSRALQAKGPSLIDIDIHYSHNVVPMVKPGKSNLEMIEGEIYE